MKASYWISLALIGVGVALAETPPGKNDGDRKPPRQRPHGEQGGKGFAEFLKRADTNGDGKVSRTEFMALDRLSKLSVAQRNEMFARLDKNGNGFVEAAEMKFAGRPPTGIGAGPRLGELDKDRDGSVNYEEFLESEFVQKLPEERRRGFFARLDRNDDGVLSPADRIGGGRDRGAGGPGGRPSGEFRPDARARFEELDSNDDGTIDFEEFAELPGLKERGEDFQEDRFEELDKNNDLKLDKNEFKALRGPSDGDGRRGAMPDARERRGAPGGERPLGDGQRPSRPDRQPRAPVTPDA